MFKPIVGLLLLALAMPSHAICLIEPLSKQIDEASTVFVATLTEAKVVGSVEQLKNGESYRISFQWLVRERVKGDADRITSLYITKLYHDPNSAIQVEIGEELTLSVGNNILVLTDETGDVQLGFCGTPTWNSPSHDDRKTLESVRLKEARNSRYQRGAHP